MNKPKLEDFYDQGKSYKLNELVSIYADIIKALDNYCGELEKALDKACALVSSLYCDYEDAKFYWTTEQWKECLLKNEKTN